MTRLSQSHSHSDHIRQDVVVNYRWHPLLTIHQFLQTDQSAGSPQMLCRQV